jgi:hypothetical protein
MTRVALDKLTWSESQVQRFIDIAYQVAKRNRNRRDVCDRIVCVTDSLETVYSYNVKKSRTDATNIGCCYFIHWWDPEQRRHVTGAVLYVTSYHNSVNTLAHEMAHALTQGSHGYTWRRMFSLLLPIAWRVFGVSDDVNPLMWYNVNSVIFNNVTRYGVRYAGSYVSVGSLADEGDDEAYRSRFEKILVESDRHFKASQRMFARFSDDVG